MSAPHSPAELQRLYKKRFAGSDNHCDRIWRALVSNYFVQWIPAHAAVLASSSTMSRWKSVSVWTSIRMLSGRQRRVFAFWHRTILSLVLGGQFA